MSKESDLELDMKLSYLRGLADGKRGGRRETLVQMENWCKADHESSFNPNLSSWRLYDHMKEILGGDK